LELAGGGDNPKPDPTVIDPPGNGGTDPGGDNSGGTNPDGTDSGDGALDTTQYLGNYSKYLDALRFISSNVGGDTTKALFGENFWKKAVWRPYPSAANLTNGTMGQHFLNDNVIRDLLASKPEDWEKRQLSSGAVWVYTAKNQAAFTVKSNSQTHRVWRWFVAEGWARPTGLAGPIVFLALAHKDNLNDIKEVCGWYESNE